MFGKHQDKTFVGVAISFILVGAAIFAFGLVGWLVNSMAEMTIMAFPSIKVMGGLVVMALGYIQLEIGLLRTK